MILAVLFFLVALVYSSVGFGGGSSYIALLQWSGMAVRRAVDAAAQCLRFYTDARSRKVAQIGQQPLGTLLAWCPRKGTIFSGPCGPAIPTTSSFTKWSLRCGARGMTAIPNCAPPREANRRPRSRCHSSGAKK